MLFKKKEEQTVMVSVKGMMCMNCVNHVKEALEALKGVKSVHVELKDGTATLIANRPLSDDEIKNAIMDAGYQFGGRLN